MLFEEGVVCCMQRNADQWTTTTIDNPCGYWFVLGNEFRSGIPGGMGRFISRLLNKASRDGMSLIERVQSKTRGKLERELEVFSKLCEPQIIILKCPREPLKISLSTSQTIKITLIILL